MRTHWIVHYKSVSFLVFRLEPSHGEQTFGRSVKAKMFPSFVQRCLDTLNWPKFYSQPNMKHQIIIFRTLKSHSRGQMRTYSSGKKDKEEQHHDDHLDAVLHESWRTTSSPLSTWGSSLTTLQFNTKFNSFAICTQHLMNARTTSKVMNFFIFVTLQSIDYQREIPASIKTK